MSLVVEVSASLSWFQIPEEAKGIFPAKITRIGAGKAFDPE